MSYKFYNSSTAISRTYSKQFWAKTLELAQLYGWQPRGTRLPALDCMGWLGSYSTNDGQTLLPEDAFLLACALEKALPDIPETNPKFDWNPQLWVDDDLPEWLSPEEKEYVEEELQDGLLDVKGTSPLQFFAGDEKQSLKHFVRFCKLGSFAIL